MHFIKAYNRVFAFHDKEMFSLACYVKQNSSFVQLVGTTATITCNRTFSVKALTSNQNGGYMLDLRINRDTKSLWRLISYIKGIY